MSQLTSQQNSRSQISSKNREDNHFGTTRNNTNPREYQTAGLGIVCTLGARQELDVKKIRAGAAANGLQVGDEIIGINGVTKTGVEIVRAMNNDKDGEFTLKVKRNEKIVNIEVKNYRPLGALGIKTMSVQVPAMMFENKNLKEMDGAKIKAGYAPSVVDVGINGMAQKMGLLPGDTILAIKRSGETEFKKFGGEVGNDEFVKYIASLKAGQKLTVIYGRREGKYGINTHVTSITLQKRTSVPSYEDFAL